MNINNYKELLLFIYLEKQHDMHLKKEGTQYLFSLNKKDWIPISRRLAKQLNIHWGIEICKEY